MEVEDYKEHNIIIGEANESDDEEQEKDQLKVKTSPYRTETPQAIIVSGEAPESDEESASCLAPEETSISKDSPRRVDQIYDSLLHKKLFECNASLKANMMSFVYKTVGGAVTQLSETEQQLLKSQIRLQNAGTALRMLNSTSNQLKEKLSNMACTSYIPHITIPK